MKHDYYDEGDIDYISTHYNENTDGVKYSNVHYSDGSTKGERLEKDRYSDGKFEH